MRYHGRIRIQETKGADLDVYVEVSDSHVRLMSGEEPLGSWCLADVVAERVVANEFEIDLDGEVITFLADDQVNFAYGAVQAMAEGWARYHSMNLLSRKRAVASARRHNEPSRLDEVHRAFGKARAELDRPPTPPAEAEPEAEPSAETAAEAEVPANEEKGGFWAKVEAARAAAPADTEVEPEPVAMDEAGAPTDEGMPAEPVPEAIGAPAARADATLAEEAEEIPEADESDPAASGPPAVLGKMKRLDALPKSPRVRQVREPTSAETESGGEEPAADASAEDVPPVEARPAPRRRPHLRDIGADAADVPSGRPVDPEAPTPAAASVARPEVEPPPAPPVTPDPISPSEPVQPPATDPEAPSTSGRVAGRTEPPSARARPAPDTGRDSLQRAAPEPEPEPQPAATAPEPEAAPASIQPRAEPQPQPEPEPEAEHEPEPEPEAEPEYEAAPEPESEQEPEPEPESEPVPQGQRNGGRRRQPAMVGAYGDGHHPAETSGLRASMRSVFSRKKDVHEHSYVESTTAVGITRRVCLECGHVSIGVHE